MRLFGHSARQGDRAVLGLSLNRIVREVVFEDVGLFGGGLDAVVRLGSAQRRAGEQQRAGRYED